MLRAPPEPGQLAPGEKRHKRRQTVARRLAHQVHPHGVPAEGKEDPVPQRQHARIAPDQIQRHRHNGVAEDFAAQRQQPARHRQRMGGRQQRQEWHTQQPQHQQDPQPAQRPRRALRQR
ncbi:Uncharacterised protein [Klebsiella pneumoniae]|nr:Uncharacterised protein [Klebsiella pneumoniae]